MPMAGYHKPRGKYIVTGVDYMCKAVEEYANKARQEGILDTIVSLVHDGLLSVTEAAKRTSLSVEEIQKLAAQQG